jgi:chlorophyll/bacteriochlorophyll a synthase
MQDTSATTANIALSSARPSLLARSIKLMKPVTWFAPAWAFLCGSIASGATQWALPDVGKIALGVLLSGPIVCGLSQVVNDYCDRDVDALNEPDRLIPSGRVTTAQVFLTIGALAVLALSVAWALGREVALLTAVGMVLAVIYSAHPIRAKRNGWIGNALVAFSYEALPWMAGHLAFGQLTPASVVIALLFAFGAHGIMTVNDFKSIDGDRALGIKTIPVLYGPWAASWLAVLTMNLAQLFVILTFVAWGRYIVASVIAALLILQLPMQRRFFAIQDPVKRAVFFNGTAIMLFVWSMLVAAIGLR